MTELSRIANANESEILKDAGLFLTTIRLYSQYFNNGQQVRTCEKYVKDYIIKLKEIHSIMENRTCVPTFNGNLFVSTGYHKNFTKLTITDAEAIDLLKRGILKVSDFAVLPSGYGIEAEIKVETPNITAKIKVSKPNKKK